MSAAQLPSVAMSDPLGFVTQAESDAALAFQRRDKECLLEMEVQAKMFAGLYSERFGRAKEEHRAAQRLLLEVQRYIGMCLPPKREPGETGRGKKLPEARGVSIPSQRASEYRQMAEVKEVDFVGYLDRCESEERLPSRSGVLTESRKAVTDYPELSNLLNVWTRQRDHWRRIAEDPSALSREFYEEGGEEQFPYEMLATLAADLQGAIGDALDAFTKPTFTVEGATA